MKEKRNLINIVLTIALIAGVALLLYPSVSDYVNSFHQTRAIAGYGEIVSAMDEDECQRQWDAAVAYNAQRRSEKNDFLLTEAETAKYNEMLNISGDGIMGYIEIPMINCSLPIYHGTDDDALQIAIGHLEWSDLPVGGEGTHCVLSGHRGLPSAKLFTRLDKLKEGDRFMLRVMDRVLTYEVDRILIVEPEDTSALLAEDGKDYCTLVTCTPYGVNSHRLLVRGHRVENEESSSSMYITADASQIEPLIVAAVIAVPVLLILLIIVMIPGGKSTKKKNRS